MLITTSVLTIGRTKNHVLLKCFDSVSGDRHCREGRRAVLCPLLAFILGLPRVSLLCCDKKHIANTTHMESWTQKLVRYKTNSRDIHCYCRSTGSMWFSHKLLCVADGRLRSSNLKALWIICITFFDSTHSIMSVTILFFYYRQTQQSLPR
jgi:hypothetical protein